jgi:hypothetical protein
MTQNSFIDRWKFILAVAAVGVVFVVLSWMGPNALVNSIFPTVSTTLFYAGIGLIVASALGFVQATQIKSEAEQELDTRESKLDNRKENLDQKKSDLEDRAKEIEKKARLSHPFSEYPESYEGSPKYGQTEDGYVIYTGGTFEDDIHVLEMNDGAAELVDKGTHSTVEQAFRNQELSFHERSE